MEFNLDIPAGVANLFVVLENWYNEVNWGSGHKRLYGEDSWGKLMVFRSLDRGIDYSVKPGAKRLQISFNGVDKPIGGAFFRSLVLVRAHELHGQLTRVFIRSKYGYNDAGNDLVDYIRREYGLDAPQPTETSKDDKHDNSTAVTNVSGGITLNGEQIEIGGDAVGRDKNIYYIAPNSTINIVSGIPLTTPPSVPDGQEQESEG